MKRILIVFLVAAAAAFGAAVDGKWKVDAQTAEKPRAAKKGGLAQKAEIVLDLRSSGSQLTGSVINSAGKRARPMEISEGKIEGDNFSFTTVQKGKKGEVKWTWRGTVKGNEITGTRGKADAKRGQPFTAKRQS